ncbi:uncharacterized protein LOC128296649 [Gossypium arboreum]|uniref:uncharacterized protein LOC128296649 n=1 Tax=Gossypium arboreum TaxID=29729 RepID=UPI0022F16EAD|nr:uncharacterized protein LOC128296649 [Gossypium arboreum]
MAEMAQLLKGAKDKGKAYMTITEEDNEDHPPGFTLPHVQTQPEAYPRRPSVTIRPQHGQVDPGTPMNFQTGSGSNPGDNPTNPVIPDLDVAEREEMRLESSRQLDERCRWLEEKFKALENADNRQGIDAKDLSLVPDLVLPHKFKMPEFEKYNGTTCPEAHITMFCRRMTGYAPFITHMFGSTTKSFADIVMAGEMIENAIRGGKIEGETAKRSAPRRKANEGSGTRQNSEKVPFMPIPVTYQELYQSLFDAQAIAPFHLKPLQPPYPKWYDANAKCEYHAGILGHSIENCTGFKKVVERLIKMGVVKFNNTPSTENSLPKNGDQGVNAIGEASMRRIKEDMAEVRMPMKVIWEEMMKKKMIISEKGNKGARDYCEFYAEEGYKIQECDEFKALVQSLMDNKELEFYEAGSDEGHVCAMEGEPKNQRINRPRIIIFLPRNNEVETQTASKVIIHKPSSFPYKDNKRVPWNYDYNVTMPEREYIVSTSKEAQVEYSYTRSGKCYDAGGIRVEPMKVKAFDIEKKNGRISVLALLLSSEVHRETLMKVLNETYITNDISVNKLDRLVCNISTNNFIYFNDDEIPPGGMGSAKALYITTRYKGYTLPSVLIDNGSALNVRPLSTLNRLPVDSSHMKTCHNVVRKFNGTERKVMGRINIPLMIGPNTYEVDFLVMDIKPSYNCLLGRHWIHSAGAVPSSLYQKLKLVIDGRLVTINVEKDIIAAVTSDAPYVEVNEEAVEYDSEERSLARKRIEKISPRRDSSSRTKGKERPFWLGFQNRSQAEEEENKEVSRKKNGTFKWKRSRVGIDDVPSYIPELYIKRDNSP